MVSKSETSETLRARVERSLENDRVSTLDRTTTRERQSDNYNGVQLNVYGEHIDVRTIIDTIAEIEGAAIESLSHISRAKASYLGIFIAYIPKQEHPAFI